MQWEAIISASVVAAIVSSSLNFIFQFFNDKRKYKEEKLKELKENDKLIIKEIYGPILIILEGDIIPGDGYDGLDSDQLTSIRKIIEINPHLVDKELDHVTYNYLEELYHLSRNQSSPNSYEKFIDFDRKLFTHVLTVYNTKKKNLNLPYKDEYII